MKFTSMTNRDRFRVLSKLMLLVSAALLAISGMGVFAASGGQPDSIKATTLCGRVMKAGMPLPDVTVTCGSVQVVTNENGFYFLPQMAGEKGKIVPSSPGYVFEPKAIDPAGDSPDIDRLDFQALTPNTVSGGLSMFSCDQYATPAEIAVWIYKADGTLFQQTTGQGSVGNWYYEFDNITSGNYRLQGCAGNCSVSPGFSDITVPSSHYPGFGATFLGDCWTSGQMTWSAYGYITLAANGQPVDGVQVAIANHGAITTNNVSGNGYYEGCSLGTPAPGQMATALVTPSSPYYSFNPPSATAHYDSTNGTTAVDFVATPTTTTMFTIVASAGPGGTISPSGNVSVAQGANQTFTVMPNLGYANDVVTVDGYASGSGLSYPFTNVQQNHTISATFRQVYQLSVVLHTGVTGTPIATTTYYPGSVVPYSYSCQSGYQNLLVKLDGLTANPSGSVTMNANHTLDVTATRITHTITASAGPGGSISPSGVVVVNDGDSKTFTIAPNPNYRIDTVKVDGLDKGRISTYTFPTVTTDHTISATFSPVYRLTVSLSEGVTGTPSASADYDPGTVVPYSYSLLTGYTGLVVKLDGSIVTNSGSVTMNANHALVVTAFTSQLLRNPDFEAGDNAWTDNVVVGTAHNIIVTKSPWNPPWIAPHSGNYQAQLCGANGTYYNGQTDALKEQDLPISSLANTATLTFWVAIATKETSGAANDTLSVQILNTGGTVLGTPMQLSNLDGTLDPALPSWVQKSVDLTAYRGQTVQIKFKGVTNATKGTVFLIDDAYLTLQ